MLSKKREAVDKHESVGRSDKVSPAKDEVLEVKFTNTKKLFYSFCLFDPDKLMNSTTDSQFIDYIFSEYCLKIP